MNRYVVLSGLPASGKSTLARALSQAFFLPLLDKDQFLEALLARKRHPGHLDDRWSYTELVANFDPQASLGPLRLGSLVEVSTEGQPDIPDLIRRVADVFAGACRG